MLYFYTENSNEIHTRISLHTSMVESESVQGSSLVLSTGEAVSAVQFWAPHKKNYRWGGGVCPEKDMEAGEGTGAQKGCWGKALSLSKTTWKKGGTRWVLSSSPK